MRTVLHSVQIGIPPVKSFRTLDSSESALAVLRRYMNRPAAMFDKYEAVELLHLLLRLARNKNHQKPMTDLPTLTV